jgi:hypothetical protein
LEKLQSHCLFTSEDCFDGVIIDAVVIVGVAQSPAELLVVRELFEFVLQSLDEETSPRDIEDFNDAIGALDEGFRALKSTRVFSSVISARVESTHS